MKNSCTLYRPVGEKEMILIANSGFCAFPPRLPWQPIFYPVLDENYAMEIAEKWNTRDEFGNFLGFVTKFEVHDMVLKKYHIQNVGAINHNELWIPAEEMEDFNKMIISKIEVINLFVGEKFAKTDHTEIEKIIKKFMK